MGRIDVGCSSDLQAEERVSSSNDILTINIYDVYVEYDKVPETIVSLNSHTTENSLTLGLGEKIVGCTYNNGEISDDTSGKVLQNHLIELAGGENIFNDLDKSWENVNWETVVERNPDYIVINDYDAKILEEKIKFF